MAQTPSVLEGASVRFSAARRYIGPSDGGLAIFRSPLRAIGHHLGLWDHNGNPLNLT
jgi:hypothetical protein